MIALFGRKIRESCGSIRGQVVDAGGGEVRIVVDRETEHYPVVGQWVSLMHWSPTVASYWSGREPSKSDDSGGTRQVES